MNWRALDLNLLVVFDAVGRHRSVTRAAAELNMTQPALSHGLSRLRAAVRDELFVRTPDGMEPTPFAQSLAGPVRAALEGLDTALASAAPFDPATATTDFAIAVDNQSALVLAAPLAAAVARDAPGVNLNLRPSGTLDLADRLDHGEIDVALGGLAASGERFRDVRLFTDQFAALVIHNHPGACDGRINLQALAAYPHLILSSTGQESDFLDAELSKCGLERRIALRAPLLTAAAMLAQSDLIAVVARRAGEVIARSAGLSVVDLPFPTPTLTTAMVWHRRVNDLAPHRWLRGIIQREARALRVNANRHSTT